MWTRLLCFIFLWHFCVCQEEVCHEPCGCFNNAPPFDDRPLPDSYESQKIAWWLFTLKNPTDGVAIRWDNIPSEYDPSKPTVYLIHGWNTNYNRQLEIKDAFLETDHDYNIIVIDWSTGAGYINYLRSASNARVVGACSGHIAEVLAKLDGNSLAQQHCMGHSLGGQCCGYMGKSVKDGETPRLGRITGLDPAGPLFNSNDTRLRLDKTDTLFMDNIHTNAQILGIGRNVGHVDFYPNKGGMQPPCDVPDPPIGGCNHGICRNYVISSLRYRDTCTFTANPCASTEDADNGLCDSCDPTTTCQKMGYYANTMPGQGGFYLETVTDYPYCEN